MSKKLIDICDLDLTSKANSGAKFELVHPVEEEGLGIFITVLGKESDLFQQNIRDRVNLDIRKNALKTNKNTAIQTVEQSEEESVELLAACTLSWENMIENGKQVDFSYETAIRVYTKYRWMRKQVDAAIGNLSLFT